MRVKEHERQRAIQMRRDGKTYSEILHAIPVAKSTLSLWFRSVNLSVQQKQKLTQRRLLAGKRGGAARKMQRLRQVADLNEKGKVHVGALSRRELWLIGVALYWAEGSKQHEGASVSSALMFANSDVRMVSFFLTWLRMVGIAESDILFELYVHSNRRNEVLEFRQWWARQLGVTTARLDRVYFKKDKPLTNRKNTKDLYHGLLRIKVVASTALNRQINGWITGIACNKILGDRLMVGQLPLKQLI